MSTSAQWHLLCDNRQYGPYTEAQLLGFVQEGRILRESLLWAEGMAEWMRADAIDGLFPAIPAPPPVLRSPSPAPGSLHPSPLGANPSIQFHGNWPQQGGCTCFSMGQFLVVRNGAVLPFVCPISNQPTGSNDWRKTVKFQYTPQWVIAIWVLSLGLGMIVSLALQANARITYSLGRKARNKYLVCRISGLILLLGGTALGVSGFLVVYDDPAGLLRIAAAGIVMLAALALLSFRPLRVKRYENGWFHLTGCHPEFLRNLER